MDFYKITWKRSAHKDLRKLPKAAIQNVLHAVEQLAEHPYPVGVKKLVGTDHIYRLRIGNYRILYSVFSTTLLIEIIRVGHRKDVYRGS